MNRAHSRLTTDHPANRDGAPALGISTNAIDFEDILAQSFGPLESLGRITKNLACSDTASGEDVLDLGYIIEALHAHGSARFMELLTQAEKNAASQAVDAA